MPPNIPFRPNDPLVHGVELFYTLVIVVIFLSIYFLTREIYQLTKHRGIKHFRAAFLFFSISYIFSFAVFLVIFSTWDISFRGNMRWIGQLVMVPMGYFSTLAIMHLGYSTIWKQIDEKKFAILALVSSAIVSLVASWFRAPVVLLVFQALLLVSIIIYIFWKNSKKMKQMRIMYILLAVFWLLNLMVLGIGPMRMLRPELKYIFQAISLIITSILLYRVIKWVR